MKTTTVNKLIKALTFKFNFEKSNLKTKFEWKFNGQTFDEYFEFNKRRKVPLFSTGEITFQSGFLAFTNHYVKCYVTGEDGAMYVKIYLEEVVLPSEFTHSEISIPTVTLKYGANKTVHSASIINASVENQLINKCYFTLQDFKTTHGCKIFWFSIPYWYRHNSLNIRTHRHQTHSVQDPIPMTDECITLEFNFEYCFWNNKDGQMQVNVPEDIKGKDKRMKTGGKLSTKPFLFSENFSDFMIRCNGKLFHAHQIILASRSSVFAVMLKEVNGRCLEIKDFQPAVVQEFLRFIYTENANTEEFATDLFKIADKYEVRDLKEICENVLLSQINASNLMEINNLGEIYKSKKLMDKCYSYFKLKRSSLLKTSADAEMLKAFVFKFATE